MFNFSLHPAASISARTGGALGQRLKEKSCREADYCRDAGGSDGGYAGVNATACAHQSQHSSSTNTALLQGMRRVPMHQE